MVGKIVQTVIEINLAKRNEVVKILKFYKHDFRLCLFVSIQDEMELTFM
jgi:hypothetical protein